MLIMIDILHGLSPGRIIYIKVNKGIQNLK